MSAKRRSRMTLLGALVLALLTAGAVYVLARPTVIDGGTAPLAWAECRPAQVEVMVLGTFHFSQVTDYVDVLEARRRRELERVLDGLEAFAPQRVAVESPHVRAGRLDSAYRQYLARPADSLS